MQRKERKFKNDSFKNAVVLTNANVPNTKLRDRDFRTVRFLTSKIFNLETKIKTLVNFCDELAEVVEKLDGITISEGYNGETVFKNYGRVFLIYKNIPYRKSLLIWSKLVKGNQQDRKEMYDMFIVALLKRKAEEDLIKEAAEVKSAEMLNNIDMLLSNNKDGNVYLMNNEGTVFHYSEYSGDFTDIKRCVKKPLVDVNGVKGIYIKNNKWEDEFVKVSSLGTSIVDVVKNKMRVLLVGLKKGEVLALVPADIPGYLCKVDSIDSDLDIVDLDIVDVVKGEGAVVSIKNHVISGVHTTINGIDAFYPFKNKFLTDALDKGVTFKDIHDHVLFGVNNKGLKQPEGITMEKRLNQ